LEKLLLLSDDNEDNSTEAEGPSFEDNGDVYGFIRTESGWFNKYTKETHTPHLLYDNNQYKMRAIKRYPPISGKKK
jgi:hypothetical protein